MEKVEGATVVAIVVVSRVRWMLRTQSPVMLVAVLVQKSEMGGSDGCRHNDEVLLR